MNAPVSGDSAIRLVRIRRPDHRLLVELAAYDEEAFGPTGLRTYDLAVVAEAGAVYVAYLQGDVVGSCQLLRVFDEPAFFYVVGFYMRPAWRGKGLAERLLAMIVQECKEAGAEGIVLTVSPGNTRALALYKSAGFTEEAYVDDFYGEGEDRFILRWRFERPGLQGGVS
jgi:ribosomal protein S18 acetylase RimI-like enzyme